MKHASIPRDAAIVLLTLLLAGCGKGGGAGGQASGTHGTVAVTSTLPKRRIFHDSVEAWGSTMSDPRRTRTISLAHGGQVMALTVAAGQAVKRGQPLLVVVPDPASRSAYRQAQNAAKLASGELGRTEQLASRQLATRAQVASARKALADALAALQEQRALGGGGARETVAAPDDGVVTALTVTLGERFAANAALLDFMPTHALAAALGVQPDAGASLRRGMPVRLQNVYGTDAAISGTLTMVGHAIDPQTHLLPVQAEIPADTNGTLFTGTALEATIQIDSYAAWAVPRGAVRHDDRGDYLFQLDRGKAHRVNVTVRAPAGDTVGVQGRLDPKLPVIVQGAYELDDGMAARESVR